MTQEIQKAENQQIQKYENEISLDNVADRFGSFIEIKGNKRIFLSGKFGVGKTYFLKDFFENNEDRYLSFHLHPVNYQISNNEDILELIKYDILVELINKQEDMFEQDDFYSFLDLASFFTFAKENKKDISKLFLSFIPKLGKPLIDTVNLIEKFQEFNKQVTEEDFVKQYLKKVKEKKVEKPDLLSEMINNKIEKMKDDKKSVLILDDLDRVDPEHIFRILNIFSCHFDSHDKNKFEFDKVILVGDMKNIKSIFHHKYGKDTDFDGYINKFYTTTPYVFNNKKAIEEKIDSLVKQIKCEEESLGGAFSEGGIIKLMLEDIFKKCIDIEELNLREVYKGINYNFPELGKGVFYKDHFTDNFKKAIDIGIKFATSILGSKDRLIAILEKIKNNQNDEDRVYSSWKERFINSMLKDILSIQLSASNEEEIGYKEYNFKIINDQNGKNFQIDNTKFDVNKLYYVVMIDYIKNNKYNKNESDYRL